MNMGSHMKNIKDITNQKRGLSFERIINEANNYYLKNNIAVINKRPTPITVLKKEQNKIIEAYLEKKSTTDYNGIYKGYYLDFDAKSTKGKYFYVSNNIKIHQIDHLVRIKEHGGISFIFVEFSDYGRFFIVPIELIISNKKITLKYLEELNLEVFFNNKFVLDYLKKVNLEYQW